MNLGLSEFQIDPVPDNNNIANLLYNVNIPYPQTTLPLSSLLIPVKVSPLSFSQRKESKMGRSFGGRPERELFFEIPQDNSMAMSYIVNAVPESWLFVFGRLEAPSDLVQKGMVLPDTGIEIGPGYRIIGEHRERDTITPCTPDIFNLLLFHKLPGFVDFHIHLWTERDAEIMHLVKDIVSGFIFKGYRGELLFYKDDPNDDGEPWSHGAECDIKPTPWNGHRYDEKEAGPQPARVRLGFRTPYGGTENDIAPVAAACRRLGLVEYTPCPNPAEAK